jgi:hypothetical protein
MVRRVPSADFNMNIRVDNGADMFRLWSLAEQDLLMEGNNYRLRDTGQGLNRVQAAPKTSRMMHTILGRAQQTLGSWVGSSVIHMGDHNVPNAFMFIGAPPESNPTAWN